MHDRSSIAILHTIQQELCRPQLLLQETDQVHFHDSEVILIAGLV